MFYSQLLMAKKGPLAKIWLAAHWDRKLNKTMIAQTDIKQAADQLKKPATPLSLRTSGHLLLGLSRIFAKKVQYLYSDSHETFHRLNTSLKPGQVDLAEEQAGAAANINMAPVGGNDFDLPELGEIDVLGGLPGLDQDFIDINSSQAFGGAVPGSSARRSGQGSEIRLNERGYGGVVPETTEDDDFDVLRSAGRRGRASDIELLRREETPAGGAGVRSSLSAGGLTGSSGAHDDDDRRSVVSDLDDSVRRRGVRADDTDPAARKKRASLAAAAINNELDGDEDKYGLGEAMGLGNLGGYDLGNLDGMGGEGGLGGFVDNDYGDGGYGGGDYDQANGDAMDLDGAGAGAGGVPGTTSKTPGLQRGLKAAAAAGGKQGEDSMGGLTIDSADLEQSAEVDEAKRIQAQAEAARKRREQKQKQRADAAATRKEDESITIPSDTIKQWLKDSSDFIAPELKGEAALAHMHKTLETARNKKLNEVTAGKASFASSAAETAFHLHRMFDNLSISPAVWSIIARGNAASTEGTGNARIDNIANSMALAAGSMPAALTAGKARHMLGLRLGGKSDLTEDGDIALLVPPIVDLEAEMARTCYEDGAVLAPGLSKLIYDHAHNKVKYPEGRSSSSTGVPAGADAGSSSSFQTPGTKSAAGAGAGPAGAVAAGGDDLGQFVDNDYGDGGYGGGEYDNDLLGAGVGADGAVDGYDWNENNGLEGEKTPADIKAMLNQTPGSGGAGAAGGLSTGKKSVLESVTMAGALARTPGAGAGAGTAADEDGGSVMGDASEIDVSSPAKFNVDGLEGHSGHVDKEKWHPQTVGMLHALASVMTGPVPSAAPTAGAKAGKKRKAAEPDGAEPGTLAPVEEGGSLADVGQGKGTPADPVSFNALSEGAQRRAAAASFFQLLVLKSWDVIDVAQTGPYADIKIARTDRFAKALAEHSQ